jgi:hypothetical protein
MLLVAVHAMMSSRSVSRSRSKYHDVQQEFWLQLELVSLLFCCSSGPGKLWDVQMPAGVLVTVWLQFKLVALLLVAV